MLFFCRLISLLLSAHVLCFGTDTNSLKDESLHPEHVVRIIFLNGHLVLANIIKKLLKQWVVRVLDQVIQVLFNNCKEAGVAFINSTVVDQRLWRLNHLASVLKGFRSVLARLSPLILS